MEQVNQELVIILPEGMDNVPVKIIRSEEEQEFNVILLNLSDTRDYPSMIEDRHALIWHQNEYERVSLNEIVWIEANGSYCCIHTTRKRTFTLSYPLARIEERLPKNMFVRIQRSFLVNINHVKKLTGCSLIVDSRVLKIGDSYKEQVFSKFIFLGVHKSPPLENKTSKKSCKKSVNTINGSLKNRQV